MGRYKPVEDSAAEGTSAARSPEEQVPDGVTKSGRLCGRGEAGTTSSTTKGDGNDLALGLTSLDVRRQERAVGQVGARKDRVARRAANLCKWEYMSMSFRAERFWGTNVGEVDGRQAPSTEEHVQERDRERVNGIILSQICECVHAS